MGRIGLYQFLGKLDRAVPMGRGRLEQEGLLQNHLILGILGERLGIEIGGDYCVMVAARERPGKIIAEQRTAVVAIVGPDLPVGGRRGDENGREENAPRPLAQSRTMHDLHLVSAGIKPSLQFLCP